MKTVYFVRHGEAEVNLSDAEAVGGPASPLTEHGREQARIIAMRAKNLQPRALVASSLRRAQETAQAIAQETGLAIETSDIFGEAVVPSAAVGKPKADASIRALMKEWEQSFYETGVRIEDGENFADMHDRARQAFAFLEAHRENEVLVVTHGHFLRYLVGVAVFQDDFSPRHAQALRWGIRTSNTGITVMLHDAHDAKRPGWHMLAWNDHAHLG